MTTPVPVASLPMYDWPEVRPATDAWWAALRDALRAQGIPAPDALSRDGDHWEDPGLVLGQTCGLPFRRHLRGRVTLLGAPDYGLDGLAPGYYCSVLVVGRDDPAPDGAALRSARYAYNARLSQSGFAALEAALGPRDPRLGVETGAHRASIRAVAEGAARVAAIDAVSWRLALAHEPAAARLRVLGCTPATPGLPMITAFGRDPAPFRAAIAAAIAALAPGPRAALGLCGFVPFDEAAYSEVA